MRYRLLKYWDTLRTSYWFIPSVMAAGAVVAASVAVGIDTVLGAEWTYRFDVLLANEPTGARVLLSTIAGSMITVAGVAFTITIAALVYATSQFGPRLLTNFLQDRGNQVTLGTFIATFIYCLLVLRTVHNGTGGGNVQAEPFVPHIAVLGGFLLALASIGVLIYFIHHLPESVHASHVTAHIGRELNEKVDQLFPAPLADAPPGSPHDAPGEAPLPVLEETASPVCAVRDGYVRTVDEDGLVGVAEERGLVLRLQHQAGDFVHCGSVLAFASPAERADEAACKAVRRSFSLGWRRTQAQDAMFLVNELVEIAARALSPGVNDPFTAMTCLDWLGSALARMGTRVFPDALHYDDEGRLRLVTDPARFEDFVDAAFGQLRPYASRDRNAALHMMKVLGRVARSVEDPARRALLERHAAALKETGEEALPHRRDAEALHRRYRRVMASHADPGAGTAGARAPS